MSRSLNMQHVAQAAGVSKSSVSLALRDDPRLALATRRRVQEIADRLGYRKNPIVASLMSQLRVSQTPRFHASFALINCSGLRTLFDTSGFSDYRRGIRECADKAGYGVEEFWADEPGVGLARLRQILAARNIRGLILVIPFEKRPLLAGHPEFFREFSVATIGFDRTEPLLNRVSNNHFETARAAVQKLFDLGYERPGIVVRDAFDHLLQRRFSAGFHSAVHDQAHALKSPPAPLLLEAMDRALFARWLKTEKPDAIITNLSEVRDWLETLKTSVPRQMGLLHLDWNPQMRDWAGMNQNGMLVGAAAAELVMDQMAGNQVGVPTHPRLVLIESDFVAGPSLARGAESRRSAPQGWASGEPVAPAS
ncbi:MAG: LacI family DNA-binding transcriptional regulator [Opitutaceae bacterium]